VRRRTIGRQANETDPRGCRRDRARGARTGPALDRPVESGRCRERPDPPAGPRGSDRGAVV